MHSTIPTAGSPIVFIHYGREPYLKRTLFAARRSNPEARIVLLGDTSNSKMSPPGVEFHSFENYGGIAKEKKFHEVFQAIQGKEHRYTKQNGVDFWLKFVFRRWFLIEAFLEKEGLDSFWTFDSDTLINADLRRYARRYAGYDCTVQCLGKCLNGWVGSRKIVSRYTDSVLCQFEDEEFLESQKIRLRSETTLAFNEMDAFAEFRSREGVKTCYGQAPVHGAIFDDALAFTEGFEVAPKKVLGKTEIKKLWSDGRNIYAKHLESGEFVRLLTCNMSWMPDYMWRRVMDASNGGRPERPETRVEGLVDVSQLREISTEEPVGDWFLRKAKLACWKLRRGI